MWEGYIFPPPCWIMKQQRFQWVLIVILVSLSGLFSGLNLGLMSLDKLGLEVGILHLILFGK